MSVCRVNRKFKEYSKNQISSFAMSVIQIAVGRYSDIPIHNSEDSNVGSPQQSWMMGDGVKTPWILNLFFKKRPQEHNTGQSINKTKSVKAPKPKMYTVDTRPP